MAWKRIAGRHGGCAAIFHLLVGARREIGSNGSHVHAVTKICLHGNAVLAASPSPIAAIAIAARGWFDHLLHA